MLRIGSANLNNRSMRLDTECDVSIDADRHPGHGLEAQVAAVRSGLLAEHLCVAPERFEAVHRESGSLIRAIERLRSAGKSLRDYEIPDLSAVEAWLADHEVLDPEGPEEMFEPLTQRGLFRWLSPPPEA
jgi:phosphatidylserine/phosphatidylglycerophosphate/cardiolipin synthase-like enzyme